MYGQGVIKGMLVTVRHFFRSYLQDFKFLRADKYSDSSFQIRQGSKTRGMFTVEYPDEKIAVPERFRFVPFLVTNNLDDEELPGWDWCTSCGICAKVCPPQCIWIVRGNDPKTGRPVPQPEAFYIDIDICMNCGYCAEFCPFDAIKMDHDYELASYDRTGHHVFDKQRLSKEVRYWRSIAPTTAAQEAEERGGLEHKDILKEKKQGKKSAASAARAAEKPASGPTFAKKAEDTPQAEAAATVPVAEQSPPQPAPAAERKGPKFAKKADDGGGDAPAKGPKFVKKTEGSGEEAPAKGPKLVKKDDDGSSDAGEDQPRRGPKFVKK